MNKQAQCSLLGYNPISARLITARFKTQNGALTVLQVYAPNTADSENVVDEFYDLLQTTIDRTPNSDILVIMGDFNAKVGKDWTQWETVLGRHGYGTTNDRGEKLLNFCALNNLCISNTFFKQKKESREWTWESPDQKTHNKIDFVLISSKWKNSVTNARSYPSADVGSDHQLVISNIRLKFKAHKKKQYPKQYDIFRLKSPDIKQTYEIEIGGRFAPLLEEKDTDADTMWKNIKGAFNDTSKKVLGYKKAQKEKPRISDEVIRLSNERSKAKLDKLNDPTKRSRYNYLNREIKRKTKGCRDKWLKDLCSKVDRAHQAAKSKEVYATIKKITQKPTTRMQTVKNKNGDILTEAEDVKERWKENFKELYNNQNPIDRTFTDSIPQMPNTSPEPGITRDEIVSAIKKLSDGKAPGFDSITAEELKAAGEAGVDILHKLCTKIWDSETFPKDWGKAIITPIYKKKDKLDCGNYRGISLLSHSCKIMTLIMQRRIMKRTEEILSEAQAGFRPGRSTVDQLFTLRQIVEKHLERRLGLYCCYIDFEKAFDSVWQEGLWKALDFFGFPSKITRLLKALYKKSTSAVRVNGELTSWFTTRVGVRQGCVISPQLFNILLELVMLYALHDCNIGVNILGQLINNLRFADDIALIANSPKDLQTLVNLVHKSSSAFGLKINIAKTEVQAISKEPKKLNINISGTQLKQVEEFIYLGGKISQNGSCTNDIKLRIGKAVGAVQKLQAIWRSKDICTNTKLELYKVLVLSILLYGAEAWTLKKEDENRLLTFEMMCLRKILGVSLLDKIRNTIIRKSLGLKRTVVETVSKKRMQYFGHTTRMPPARYPKMTLETWMHGKRPRGRPPKRWTDNLKEDLEIRKIESITEAGKKTQDRELWQSIVDQMSPLNP